MIATSVKYRGYLCFKNDWAGFDSLKPVNVIIGRNNTGKSLLLNLAAALCGQSLYHRDWHCQCRCEGILDETDLQRWFQPTAIGNELPGNHWTQHGQKLIGHKVTWTIDQGGGIDEIIFQSQPIDDPRHPYVATNREGRIRQLVGKGIPPLSGRHFHQLLADRDISPELEQVHPDLTPNGEGATNIIRSYIVKSSEKFPRELVQKDLLAALNEIFGSDGQFTEITVQKHEDGDEQTRLYNCWEVYLGEGKKGLVKLSRSGSGLKTILLVLINLLVMPHLKDKPKRECVFAFEELENNLHPALLRRLFRYLEAYAIKEQAVFFLTTHSSVALDLFGMSEHAQIIHVTHDGESAKTETATAHFDHLGVISELGAKPSDLLQANGIIWVEGPSDRIYLNRWIDLFSEGQLQEGRDYQCAFYGGALLARTQFVTPEKAVTELINLIRINTNVVVVCDSDRTASRGSGSELKDRVQRIATELKQIPDAHIWITEAKEIENYLPGSVLGKVFKAEAIPDPQKHERFFPSEKSAQRGKSFAVSQLKRNTIDKVELALQAAPHMTKEELSKRFDLAEQIEAIIECIRHWNS